jgi:fused signal recognition particle receptor
MSPSLFSAIRAGLTKTREALIGKIEQVFTGKARIDEEALEELEAVLIQSDLGVKATESIMEALRKRAEEGQPVDSNTATGLIEEEILRILGADSLRPELAKAEQGPTVILMVGVNGTGKTTSAGKIASMLSKGGHGVMLAAADTFRAAAIEQLEVWGRRVGAPVIKHQEGSDPAAVAFDAFEAARARGVDYLIVDTAGRLHTKSNLMEELKKIKRVLGRAGTGAPHEVLLVVDATTGQNAIAQARVFNEAVELTGIVLTKLDGTARGGIVVAICSEFGIPVKYVGVGEGVDDLRPFDPREFASSLVSH